MKEIKTVTTWTGGGGSPEPVASATLGLRLALNATARACGQKRGFARRALDSAQGKPCSVALLGLAFTMAEILLSLTIIGVVAAITLPSLTGNINERTWNTQRKALYARFSQAISLMPALNGYGTLTENTDSAGSTSIEDTAAETFVTDGLAKVLKINNICDSEHLADCGIPSVITNLKGSKIDPFPATLTDLNPMFNSTIELPNIAGSIVPYTYSLINTKAAAFETANGESIAVYYNPNCKIDDAVSNEVYTQGWMCANFIYDLNGTKGPNTMGKDIGFITALYAVDSVVVAPMPHVRVDRAASQQKAGELCKSIDDEYRVPNRQEMAAIFYNRRLYGTESGPFWTSSQAVSSYYADGILAYGQNMGSGCSHKCPRTSGYYVSCVKR